MASTKRPLVVHIDAKESPLELERQALAGIDYHIVSIPVSSEGEVNEAIKNATVFLNDHSPVTANIVQQLPECRMIIRHGHGCDTVNVDVCTEAGIIVTNITGSPEIGWATIRRRDGEEAARLLRGQRPDVFVNPEVLGRV
jgi:phosphoglycerate dehydrogenase-like enzyme